jgi:hypothetical protein
MNIVRLRVIIYKLHAVQVMVLDLGYSLAFLRLFGIMKCTLIEGLTFLPASTIESEPSFGSLFSAAQMELENRNIHFPSTNVKCSILNVRQKNKGEYPTLELKFGYTVLRSRS